MTAPLDTIKRRGIRACKRSDLPARRLVDRKWFKVEKKIAVSRIG